MTQNINPSVNEIDCALASINRADFIQHDQPELISGHSIPAKRLAQQILYQITFPPDATILQIGAGSGYFTALLSQLAKQVYAVEKQPQLAEFARTNIEKLHIHNVTIIHTDGTKGLNEHAPFDIIVVSTPSIQKLDQLIKQLKVGGQLLCLETLQQAKLLLVRYKVDIEGSSTREELGIVNFSRDNIDLLVDMGIADESLLDQAKKIAQKNRTSVLKELHQLINIEDHTLYRSLAHQSGLPVGEVEDLLKIANPSLFHSFSKAFLDSHRIIPLVLTDDSLVFASSDTDPQTHDLRLIQPNKKLKQYLVTPTDFHRLWSALDLSRKHDNQTVLTASQDTNISDDLLEESHTQLNAHLITVFNAMLLDAVASRASDIHIEQYHKRTRVRLRVDGELRDLSHYDLSPMDYLGLINVIKLRAELNIAEKRLPQGGRSHLVVGGDTYDLRVQIQPSLYGEHAIIRLLPQNQSLLDIKQLGFSEPLANSYERLLQNPAGLVLVVGPTGSGKSTTLYAGLQTLAHDSSRKVITVEDPIEYSIDGIQQTRVRPDIGFHFSDAMRAFVRQDPDVILVGEIRDKETALEAVRASQTGHVVLSTLHSNDAIDALQRLYDLDIQANSLASELLSIIAQRLAKRICPHCKVSATPNPDILNELFPRQVPHNFQCFTGEGCKHCNGQGTSGRIAVIEYLQINPDLRKAIALQPPIVELRQLALDTGLMTMRDSALSHVIQGTIALDELPRILPQERMAPERRGLLT
ncbi:hypothetical protein NBRC116495_22560 [Aurantivibrio plasticivorans]